MAWTWALAVALLSGPRSEAAPPLVTRDAARGTITARSGTSDDDFVLTAWTGTAAAGHFTLTGGGRTWVTGPGQPGERGDLNVVITGSGLLSRATAASPVGTARVERIQASRTGTLSAGVYLPGYADAEGKPVPDAAAWRTIGFTHQGVTGATVVVVDGSTGLGDRHQVWQLDLGDIPAECVTVDGLTFTAAPPRSPLTLRGTFIYPSTVHIDLEPAAGGHGLRILAHREKPTASVDQVFEETTDRLVSQVENVLKGEDGESTEWIYLKQFKLEEQPDRSAEERTLLRNHQLTYLKLLQATSSVKMGGGDRAPKARGGWVAVLTVTRAPQPAVGVPDAEHDAMLTVAGTPVTYSEYLIEFGEATAP